MYHYEWYIANQLVTFNDALRALVGFRNRDASSRALRSFSLRFRLDKRDISPGAEMIARFLDVLEDTVKNLTWRPAELQAIDAPPALDYRTPDYTANAAKYMDLYGAKRRAEAKYAEVLERAEQARRNVAVVLEKASPATLAAAAKKSAAAGIADSRRDDPAKTIR